MINVGILGLGFMGKMHYNTYAKIPGVKVAAIADKDPAKTSGDWSSIGGNIGDGKGAKEDLSGINTYDSIKGLLKDDSLDVIDICLPTDLHAKATIQALKAGKHVFCEKPMARTTKECEKVVEAARKAKGYVMFGHCIRMWPEYDVAIDMIKKKKYGPVRAAFFRRVSPPPVWASENWLLTPRRSGAALLDLHIHDVDYALRAFGKPARVTALSAKGASNGDDQVFAIWNYKNGPIVEFEGAWAYPGPYPFNMEFTIRCAKATIQWNMGSGKPLTVYTETGKEITPKTKDTDGYYEELKYFTDCIKKGKKPDIITAPSSRDAVWMIEQELRSIKSGKTEPIRK